MTFKPDIVTTPGEETFVDVVLNRDECAIVGGNDLAAIEPPAPLDAVSPQNAPAPNKIAQKLVGILDGGQARLALTAPLFSGDIKPVSVDSQRLVVTDAANYWSWQVRSDKPGVEKLSLVLTILDADGKQVELANPRATITVTTSGTPAYYVGFVWNGFVQFIQSLAGLITGAVAAAVAVLGLWPKLRRRKEHKSDGPRSDAGYY